MRDGLRFEQSSGRQPTEKWFLTYSHESNGIIYLTCGDLVVKFFSSDISQSIRENLPIAREIVFWLVYEGGSRKPCWQATSQRTMDRTSIEPEAISMDAFMDIIEESEY